MIRIGSEQPCRKVGTRRFLSLFLITVCLAASGIPASAVTCFAEAESSASSADTIDDEKTAPSFLHLPEVGQDSASPSGQKTTWSCVYFGSYPSAEVADSVPYDAEYKDVFWEDSDLRGWLNGTGSDQDVQERIASYGSASFLESAFDQEERQAIMLSDVRNSNNYYFGTACGSGTRDQVFILSEEEVFSSDKAEKYGFQPSDAIGDCGRRMKPTAYAAARGAWQSEEEETAGVGFWILRTNGYTQDNVVYVGEKGYLYNRGIPVTCPDAGIVPVIRVRLGAAPCVRVEDIGSR